MVICLYFRSKRNLILYDFLRTSISVANPVFAGALVWLLWGTQVASVRYTPSKQWGVSSSVPPHTGRRCSLKRWMLALIDGSVRGVGMLKSFTDECMDGNQASSILWLLISLHLTFYKQKTDAEDECVLHVFLFYVYGHVARLVGWQYYWFFTKQHYLKISWRWVASLSTIMVGLSSSQLFTPTQRHPKCSLWTEK